MSKPLLSVLFVILCYLNYRHLELGFLSLHSIDEYAFHGILLKMYDGLVSLNVKQLFSFSFHSYGFGFFFLNLIATIPFLIVDNIAMVIYVPRLVTSMFAVGSLWFVYKTAEIYTDKTVSTSAVMFIAFMPAFWRNAMWFHPDWMMTFFVILSLYFFARDNFAFRNYFWCANISLGAALASKIQALTCLPLLLFYLFYDNLAQLKISDFFEKFKLLLKSCIIILTVFVLTNPYLIHPKGMRVFFSSFVENMQSNASNHGIDVQPTVIDKLNNAVGFYYLNQLFFFSLVVISILLIARVLKRNVSKSIFPPVAAYSLINIVYLFTMVNKDWQHYYLTIFCVSALLWVYAVNHFTAYRKTIVAILLLTHVVFNLTGFNFILTRGYHPELEISKEKMTELSAVLVRELNGHVNKNTNILIDPYLPFDFLSLGLRYDNIHVIYGPISDWMLNLEAFLEKNPGADPSRFLTKDFIIISKKSVYFDEDAFRLRLDKKGYEHAISLIKALDSGLIGYEKFGGNQFFYIWRKI